MRWIMKLQEFDLNICHRKGKKSGNVDGLTRDSTQSTRPYGEEPIESLYDAVHVISQDVEMNSATRAAKRTLPTKETHTGSKKAKAMEKPVIDCELDEKHGDVWERVEEEREREKNEKAETKEDWVNFQNDATSKFMEFVRKDIRENKE